MKMMEIKGIADYVNFISATMPSVRRKRFLELVKHSEETKPVLMKEALSEGDIELIKELKIIPKACYQNAYKLAQLLDVYYEEGYVQIFKGFVIPHAWNRTIAGDIFDATFELNSLGLGISYFSLFTGMAVDIEKLSLESGVYGGYVDQLLDK